MNHLFHRLTALILSVTLAFSMAVSVWAEALPSDLPVTPETESFYELSDDSSSQTEDAASSVEKPSGTVTENTDVTIPPDTEQQETSFPDQSTAEETPDTDAEQQETFFPDQSTTEETPDTDPADWSTDFTPETNADTSADASIAFTDPAETAVEVETESSESSTQTVTVQAACFHVTQTKEQILYYDDRYTFQSDYCALIDDSTANITSYQVVSGVKKSQKDTAVLTLASNSQTKVIAAGVGTVTVYLVSPKNLTNAQNILKGTGTTSVDAIQVNVTVKPAPLTIMYLAGQSNMEGSSSATTGAHPEDSIVCEEGQVYSTYAPSLDSRASTISGIKTLKACSSTGAKKFVAGALTTTKSVSGLELVYPLNQLTKNGGGKTGMDSGLAYQWNKLTGEKVWTVNSGWGGSSVSEWRASISYTENGVQKQRQGTYYAKAVNVFQVAKSVYEAEISAGHYTKAHQLYFWMQGENTNDQNRTYDKYLSYFKSMYNGMKSVLGFEQFGFVSTRANEGNDATAADLNMTVPRVVQYYLAVTNAFPEISMVSNQNEQWISDAGVKRYFASAYQSGKLTYPLRKNATISAAPTTLKEVHTDVHYSQAAHNENGILAAKGMYDVITNGTNTAKTAQFLDKTGTPAQKSFSCELGDTVTLIPSASPSYGLKGAVCATDSDKITYNVKTGSFVASVPDSTVTLSLSNADGETLDSIAIAIGSLPTPNITAVTAYETGIGLDWKKISSATKYRVYRKAQGDTQWTNLTGETGDVTTNSYFDSADHLKAGVTYTYVIKAYIGSISMWTDKSNQPDITYLTAPQLKSIKNTSKGPVIQWSKVTGAEGYAIYRRTSTSAWKSIDTISNASTLTYTDTSKLTNGTTYLYTVCAVSGKSSSPYNTTGLTTVFLTRPAISSVSNSASKKMTVKWAKNTKASGYLLRYSTDKTFKTAVKTVTITKNSTVSSVISGLTKKKTYYVALASYQTVNGQKICSDWSAVKTITIKK